MGMARLTLIIIVMMINVINSVAYLVFLLTLLLLPIIFLSRYGFYCCSLLVLWVATHSVSE